ncbi:hypothetical protein F5Y04DRAFT_290157 [Hypomontagnella monticulosa]|nr:hypothetical protein F5Y04DRAFT_290157 [Hypomontagnella monticulosa]
MQRLKSHLRRRSKDEGNSMSSNTEEAETHHSRSRSDPTPIKVQAKTESPRRIKGPRHSLCAGDVARYDIKTHGPLECTSGYPPIIGISRTIEQPQWPLRNDTTPDICTFQIPERSIRRASSPSHQAMKGGQPGDCSTQLQPDGGDNTSSTESGDYLPVARDGKRCDTPEELYEDCLEEPSPEVPTGVVSGLTNTVDTDETITYAPAVTHERVRPHVHEIIQEQIYREIHNYDVYHRIQPIYDIEVLPARHLVRGEDDNLVEVSEDKLPECTGQNQKWYIGKGPAPSIPSPPQSLTGEAALDNPCEEPTDRSFLEMTEPITIRY